MFVSSANVFLSLPPALSLMQYTGIVVIVAMMGLMCCCCISCGLCLSCPRMVKIVAAITIIPASLCILFYFVWLALGTFLIAMTGSDAYSKSTCRNILVYLIFLYLYLICAVVFWIIVGLWRINSLRSSKSSSKKKTLIPMDSMKL